MGLSIWPVSIVDLSCEVGQFNLSIVNAFGTVGSGPMRRVLVVEDSAMVLRVLKHVLNSSHLFEFDYAESFAQARDLVENNPLGYFAALVDLNLPDAPEGEVVDYTLDLQIPTVVLTGSFSEERRETLLAKGIVDYVTKEGRYSYDYARGVLTRLVKNQAIKVLVVDDSETARKFTANLLRLHLYQVIEAGDGVQAIKVLIDNPDIKLLITDFNMPRMDGCELVKNIRVKYEKSDLVIIGVSSENEGKLSARFIKNGANDFLHKPFHHEEFYCRISHNVEFIEIFEKMRDLVNRDDQSGAYNRKYFFQKARDFLVDSQASGNCLSVAHLEVENFHTLSDCEGPSVADDLIRAVVRRFDRVFDRFLFAYAGNGEFYIAMPGLDCDRAVAFIERVRQVLCADPIALENKSHSTSFSAGVSARANDAAADSIDDMMRAAADCLRRAKDAGGDLVFGDD